MTRRRLMPLRKVVCSQVIRERDSEHADAFEGIDLEELDEENGQADNG